MTSDLRIHSVCACCKNWGIGFKNNLPWKLPNEYGFFTRLTIGDPPEGKKNVVIMGRKTWDCAPKIRRPLQNRINIVVRPSRTLSKQFKGPHAVVSSLDEAVSFLQSSEWCDKIHEVYCTGGHDIYKLVQDSPYCGYIFLTRIMEDFTCDVFYPKFDEQFKLVPNEMFGGRVPVGVQYENNLEWKVEVYCKKL